MEGSNDPNDPNVFIYKPSIPKLDYRAIFRWVASAGATNAHHARVLWAINYERRRGICQEKRRTKTHKTPTTFLSR
jgi:hypothetical protein